MNSPTKQEWFTAYELEGFVDLPKKASNITRKATKENWVKRQIKGKKGVAFEYHYSSFPEKTQKALGFSTNATETAKKELNLQQRIDLLEQKLQTLENKALSATTNIKPTDLTEYEWLLVQAFRRCNEDRKLIAMSAVEALAAQTEKEQKESEIAFKDHQIA